MVSKEDIIRLQLVNGLGRKTIKKVLDIIEYNKTNLKNFPEIIKFISHISKKKIDIEYDFIEEQLEEIIETCNKHNIKILSLYDNDYSKKLRSLEDKPLILYVQGRHELIDNDSNIAIVGTRKPSMQSYEISSIFAEKLTQEGCCIVSGFANGCDEAAHMGCLLAKGKTITVIPYGHLKAIKANKVLYNLILINDGAIVSELPPNEMAQKYTYIERNRLIAASSEGVIVIEGGANGGTSHTVKFAQTYNKPVAYTLKSTEFNTNIFIENQIDIIDSFDELVKFTNKIFKKTIDIV